MACDYLCVGAKKKLSTNAILSRPIAGILPFLFSRLPTARRFKIFLEDNGIVVFLVFGGEEQCHSSLADKLIEPGDGFEMFLQLANVPGAECVPFARIMSEPFS